jgi:hypothetical protein
LLYVPSSWDQIPVVHLGVTRSRSLDPRESRLTHGPHPASLASTHTCTNQPLGDSHQSQAIVIYNDYVHTSAQTSLAQHLMLAAYVLRTRDPYIRKR